MNTPAAPAAYDLAPAATIALLGALLAAIPLVWLWFRHRDAGTRGRLHALTVMALFLTFDLVLFGAFTRLSDSGLGCPDWPGCYGNASPFGAHHEIQSAQLSLPSGPVTHGKAWIEMTHRYLATAVGAVVALLAAWSWLAHRRRLVASASQQAISPWWATATLAWICLQGAFGALTVTMKLYPAIVTAHLLGGLVLLALLVVQAQSYRPAPLALPRTLSRGVRIVAVLALVQIALGGWVSTNYAVLACGDFPTCQGAWWPTMDFTHGFTLLRELGAGKDGGYLPFAALTAIHMTHRIGAVVVLGALAWLVWAMHAVHEPAARRFALALAGVGLWQLASGLGNIVLGWPLLSALAHTGGAAALVIVMTTLLMRARTVPVRRPAEFEPASRTARWLRRAS
jgi:cytochrome c oxidase assembly protein subunit 15